MIILDSLVLLVDQHSADLFEAKVQSLVIVLHLIKQHIFLIDFYLILSYFNFSKNYLIEKFLI